MFCDDSKLVTLYKIGEVHFRLLGKNCFDANERLIATGSRCRPNLKNENLQTKSKNCTKKRAERAAPKSVPNVQHDFLSSFNQPNHWLVALSLP